MEFGSVVVLLLVVVPATVLYVALPWWALCRARTAAKRSRSGEIRAAKLLAVIGVVLVVLAPIVYVGAMVIAFAAVANADSASKATMLARDISTAANCGVFIVLAAILASALSVALVWGHGRNTNRGAGT
jgi:hypothetical protein